MEFVKRHIHLISTILAILSVVLTGVAIYAGYDIYNRTRPVKRLVVKIIAIIPVVDVNPEASGDITIFYKGQLVENVALVQIQLSNTGNQPILPSDFIEPISFQFQSDAEIADVSVTDSNPPNIGMVISKTSDYQAEVTPVLLNPGDTVTIRFAMVANERYAFNLGTEVRGRIVGIKSIELAVAPELSKAPSNPRNDLSTILIAIAVPIAIFILTNILSLWYRRHLDRLSNPLP